jgi:hypothetical protein
MAFLGLLLPAGLAGCELLAGITDKSTEADASVPAPDDGGPSPEAATAEAAADASVPCMDQAGYLFCDDFDHEARLQDRWYFVFGKGGGTVDYDTIDYTSSPRSVVFTTPMDMPAQAQLGQQNFPITNPGFEVAFDLRIDIDSYDGILQMGLLQAQSQESAFTLNYVLGPGPQAAIELYQAGSTTPRTTAVPPPALRKFVRVAMRYDAAAGAAVLYDGVPAASAPGYTVGAPGMMMFILGVVYINGSAPSSTMKLEADNFVIR